MSPWMNESQDLFRTARRATSPSAEDRARVRARLAARLGAATMAGAAVTVASGTADAGLKVGAIPAAVKVLVVSIGVIAVASAVLSRPRPQPHALSSSSAPRAIARAVPAPPPPTPPVPASPTPAPPVVAARAPVSAPPAEDPAAEAQLARSMDRALRDGDAAGALRLAAEHERRFPLGVLSEEREGVRAMARCVTGERSAGEAFLRAHPRSPLRARIAKVCER